jgi:hypothetical protein
MSRTSKTSTITPPVKPPAMPPIAPPDSPPSGSAVEEEAAPAATDTSDVGPIVALAGNDDTEIDEVDEMVALALVDTGLLGGGGVGPGVAAVGVLENVTAEDVIGGLVVRALVVVVAVVAAEHFAGGSDVQAQTAGFAKQFCGTSKNKSARATTFSPDSSNRDRCASAGG